MKIGAVLVLIFTLLAASIFWGTRPAEPLAHVGVVLTDAGFEPRDFSIKRGGTVTFSTDRDVPFWPASNVHPDHSLYPAFDPKRPLGQDETWTFTFDEAGDWGFHDHVRSYFSGTVYVVE